MNREEKHIKRIIYFLALIPVFFNGNANAEETWTHYYHKKTNQLYNITVAQEHIWCGHEAGILKWEKDGSSYINYEFRYGYNGGKAFDSVIDKNGVLWVVSYEGIMYYDNDTWNSFPLDDNASDKIFHVIEIDLNGSLWIGATNYIARFDGENWRSYEFDGYSQDIACDRSGYIWLATNYGVRKLEDDTWREFTVEDGLVDSYVYDIEFDESNTGWFAAREGVSCYDGETWKTVSTRRNTMAAVAGKDGVMWFAVSSSDSNGVFSYDGTNWKYYEQMAATNATDIDEDCDGTVWCGTHTGLYKKEGETWVSFLANDGMPDVAIGQIAAGSNRNVWIGTTNVGTIFSPIEPSGVLNFDGSDWRQFTVDDGLGGNDVKSIAVDTDGVVWCGFPGSISRYDGRNWTSWRYPEIHVYDVRAIAFDLNGSVWFGHNDGLLKYDTEKEEFADYSEYFNNQTDLFFHAVAVDNNNALWIGSKGGIYKLEEKEWSFYADPFSHDDIVNSLAVDFDGSLWISTYYHGIRHFDGNNWKLYDKTNALPSDNVREIEIDSSGVKWTATDRGICLFDGNYRKTMDSSNSPVSNVRSFALDASGRIWIAEMWDLYSVDGFEFSVSVVQQPLPELFPLSNHPNPFNLSTSIDFMLPSTKIVSLSVYSATGQKIRTLCTGTFSQGKHSVRWNGLDDDGRPVSSGVYIAGLKSGNRVMSHRMILMK